MRWFGLSIIVITSLTTVTFGRSPSPDLARAEELYRRTEYGRAIDALQKLEGGGAAAYALLGKAFFMDGQYKQAVANLEKAIGQDSGESDCAWWLGRAYGRLAEQSSFMSALGQARKTGERKRGGE